MDKKGGKRCAMKNCESATYRDDKSYFRFPKDPERSLLWATACGREDLANKDSLTLYKNYRVCCSHFTEQMFLNNLKNRLHTHAVPIPVQNVSKSAYDEENIVIPSTSRSHITHTSLFVKDVTTHESDQDADEPSLLRSVTPTKEITGDACHVFISSTNICTQTDITLSSNTPRKEKLRRKITSLRRELLSSEKSDSVSHFNTDNITLHQFELLCDKFLPNNIAVFVKSQAKFNAKKAKGRRYDSDFKQFCLTLYFLGPKAYKNLSKTFYFPSTRTLERYIQNLKFGPGIHEIVIQCIQLKTEHYDIRDKMCIMCIDEMSLKAHLFYNITQDEVIGFAEECNIKSFKPACNVAVIMIRGLTKNWKQPIGYYFLHSTFKVPELIDVIYSSIVKLNSVGINVVGLVTDMGSNFISLSTTLGITPDQTYFEVNGKKIFYIFDTPHLMKATRTNLMKYSFVHNDKNTSWEHIKIFYESDKKLSIRLAPKLTESHINPTNFEKMKVKLATQVLSASVAAGLNTYLSLGALPPEAIGTIEFILRFNNLFDILNSSSVTTNNPYNKPFCANQLQIEFLKETLQYLKNVRVLTTNQTDVTNQIKSLHCWQTTINSIISLFNELQRCDFKFFLQEGQIRMPWKTFLAVCDSKVEIHLIEHQFNFIIHIRNYFV